MPESSDTFIPALSNACVSFLLQDNALIPYQEKVALITQQIANLKKTIEAKTLQKDIDEVALQLELLVDIVNNLKIEDASHSTQIIENISLIFSSWIIRCNKNLVT